MSNPPQMISKLSPEKLSSFQNNTTVPLKATIIPRIAAGLKGSRPMSAARSTISSGWVPIMRPPMLAGASSKP